MTKWSFEVPIGHLKDFDSYQDYIFALPHLIPLYPDYEDYLKKSSKDIIMDNSSNELGTPISNEHLMAWAYAYNPKYLIAPDDDRWSIDFTFERVRELKRLWTGPILYVVRNLTEKVLAKSIGVEYTIPYEYRFTAHMAVLYEAKHFLGLNNPLEVRIFKPVSIDTGMPIKLAIQGMTIDKWLEEACPHIHTTPGKNENYFDTWMTGDQIDLARKNIETLKEICQ